MCGGWRPPPERRGGRPREAAPKRAELPGRGRGLSSRPFHQRSGVGCQGNLSLCTQETALPAMTRRWPAWTSAGLGMHVRCRSSKSCRILDRHELPKGGSKAPRRRTSPRPAGWDGTVRAGGVQNAALKSCRDRCRGCGPSVGGLRHVTNGDPWLAAVSGCLGSRPLGGVGDASKSGLDTGLTGSGGTRTAYDLPRGGQGSVCRPEYSRLAAAGDASADDDGAFA